MNQESDEQRGFRVSDRRRFTERGEERPDAGDAPGPEGAAVAGDAPGAEPGRGSASGEARTEGGAGAATVELSFSTFVLSLSTQALLHLGEIPDPQTGVPGRDLAAARQVIDILGILKQKTVNNLERAEEALLDSVLHDLRMAFVRLVRTGTAKEGS